MSDLEGLTRRLMTKIGVSDENIIDRLVQEYLDFKNIDKSSAYNLANAVLEECRKSDINSLAFTIWKVYFHYIFQTSLGENLNFFLLSLI